MTELFLFQAPKPLIAYTPVDVIHWLWTHQKSKATLHKIDNKVSIVHAEGTVYKVFEPTDQAKTFTSIQSVYCQIEINGNQATVKYNNGATTVFQWNAGRWTLLTK